MLTPDVGHLDRRIAQEATTLAGRGWTVDIWATVDPDLAYDDDLPAGVRLIGTSRSPLPEGRRRGVLRWARRALARVVPPLGRVVEVWQYRRRRLEADIAEANLPDILRLDPFDLVVAHDVPMMPLGARLKEAWNARLISDLHEMYAEQDEYFTTQTARRYWRGLEGAGLAVSDGIICVNAAVARYVVANYAPSAPMVTITNAVPFQLPSTPGPSIRQIYAIPEEARVLVFAGSLRPNKNLEALIEGFKRARLDGWVLAILGEGPLREQLEATIRRQGQERTVFVGQRAGQRDLIHVASTADVGILPYQALGLNYQLATPNKLFEYIQARLPIATSKLPEIERIVAPLGTAGFVDYSGADSTARGLVDFIRDVLPTITGARLEAAAAAVSWEREEPVLLDLVSRATGAVEPREDPPT